MSKLLKNFLILIFVLPGQIAICQIDKEEYNQNPSKDTINGVYIPQDLHDCFVELDKVLTIEQKDQIRSLANKDATNQLHNTTGKWIRDNWELWRGSRLLTYFKSKKIIHPDRISALILRFYYDWLHNENQNWEAWVAMGNQKIQL